MRQSLNCLQVLKASEGDSNFYHFDVEEIVARILNSSSKVHSMTFCPVMGAEDKQAEACNSLLFGQSALFGIPNMWAGNDRVSVRDIVKVSL